VLKSIENGVEERVTVIRDKNGEILGEGKIKSTIPNAEEQSSEMTRENG